MAGETVLVTGASGFIAAHVVQQLVEQGYKVIGTVRSDAKGDFFKKQYGDKFDYEIVKDISTLDAFDHVFKAHPDIVYVLHTASPFHFKSTDHEKDLLIPAINGTRSALTAADKFGANVKKVVITSSLAAMMQNPPRMEDHSMIYTSADWNPITYELGKKSASNAYVASKKLAESTAWDYIKEKSPKYAITTIQIPIVYGPPINDVTINSLSTSTGQFYGLIKQDRAKNPNLPRLLTFYIDVRDAATAHVRAMTCKELDNKRSFHVGGLGPAQRFVDTLRKLHPELDATLPIGEPGSYDPKNYAQYDVSDAKKYLNMEYISFEKTVEDTYERLRQIEKDGEAKL